MQEYPHGIDPSLPLSEYAAVLAAQRWPKRIPPMARKAVERLRVAEMPVPEEVEEEVEEPVEPMYRPAANEWAVLFYSFESLPRGERIRPLLAAVKRGVSGKIGRGPFCHEIETMVLVRTGIAASDIQAHNKAHACCRARHMIMYLNRRYTETSMSKIGCNYARNHSSVLRAIRGVVDRYERDPDFAYVLDDVEDSIRHVFDVEPRLIDGVNHV